MVVLLMQRQRHKNDPVDFQLVLGGAERQNLRKKEVCLPTFWYGVEVLTCWPTICVCNC